MTTLQKYKDFNIGWYMLLACCLNKRLSVSKSFAMFHVHPQPPDLSVRTLVKDKPLSANNASDL